MEKFIDIQKIIEFLELNEGIPMDIDMISYNSGNEGRSFNLIDWKLRTDAKTIYIEDIEIPIEYIANFYNTTDWGSEFRIALYAEGKNKINEINLTCKVQENNVNKPFKLTEFAKELIKR